jgi:hypothetical protein
MTDAEPSSVPPVPISEHSRVLIAMHKISARFRLLAHRDRVWEPRFARVLAPL